MVSKTKELAFFFFFELLFIEVFVLNNLIQPSPCSKLSWYIFIEWVILVIFLEKVFFSKL